MIYEHFKSPNTILANMRQDEFALPNAQYGKEPFFTEDYRNWFLKYWVKGFNFKNLYTEYRPNDSYNSKLIHIEITK